MMTQTTKLPLEKTWHISKTLLGCGEGSDVNRRYLERGFEQVVCFNHRMAEWHHEDDKALQNLCDYLNKMERENATI